MSRRVALVVGQLSQGGMERQVATLARRLARRGRWEPVVHCLSEALVPHGVALAQEGIRVTSARRRRHHDPSRVWTLARHFAAEKPDVVYGFLHTGSGYAALAARFGGLCPVIAGIRSMERGRRGLTRAFDRFVLRRAAAVVVNSRAVAEFLRRDWGLDAIPYEILLNGIDLEAFDAAPPAAPTPIGADGEDRPVVLGVGLIKKEKDIPLFLEVATRLASHPRRPRLVWVGGGDRVWLQRAAQAAGVEFIGARDDAWGLLKTCHSLLMTSQSEGLPNVVLEAMAARRPVVACAVGGIPELVEHERTGLLCGDRDPDKLAALVVRLLDDAALATSLGSAGRRRVETEFSDDVMAARTEALLDRVLAQRRRVA